MSNEQAARAADLCAEATKRINEMCAAISAINAETLRNCAETDRILRNLKAAQRAKVPA